MFYNEDTYVSSALEASAAVRTAFVKLYSAVMFNAGAGTNYFQLWNGNPAAGGTLIQTVQCPTKTTGAYDFGERGFPSGSSGLYLVCSSTERTFTGAAEGHFCAVYA